MDLNRSTFDPEFDLTGQPITVTTQVHETRQMLRLAYNDWVGPDNEVQDGDELLGWATWDLEEGTCTIHIDRQLISGPIRKFEEIIGHEYLHCLYGRYHD